MILVAAVVGSGIMAATLTDDVAVTAGRAFTGTFAGIASSCVLPFVGAQLVGAAIGAVPTGLFHPRPRVVPEPLDLPGPVHDGTGRSLDRR